MRLLALLVVFSLTGCTVVGLAIDPATRARLLDRLPACEETVVTGHGSYAGTGALVGVLVDVAVIATVVIVATASIP